MTKKIQKVLSFLLCAALLGGLAPLVFAEDAPITGVSGLFNYTVNDGKATITYCDRSVSGELTVPSTIEGYPVASIGIYAFGNCKALTGVTVPAGVTDVDQGAFENCTALLHIALPDGVTRIGSGAFNGTAYYQENFTNSLKQVLYIGDYLIRAKDSLIGSYQIRSGTKLIADWAFSNCGCLTGVTLPDSLTSLGERAFADCAGLTSVTIPNSVTNIGYGVFENCTGLTNVTIPNSVTSIGSFAFKGCSALTNVTIPAGVASIGSGAFAACSRLTAITVDSQNQAYSCDGNGILYNKAQTELIQYPGGNRHTAFTVPAGVTSIGDSAFYDCDALTSVTLPDSVTSIGNYIFFDCDALTSLTVPADTTEIGYDIFRYCPMNPYIIGVPGSFAETYAKENNIGFVSLGSGQLPVYTVTFDANGGTDAPAEQTKVRGETVTLTPEKPTREGYVFLFWSTCPVYPATVLYTTYQAGETYSADRSIRLYAIWAPAGAAVHSVSVEDLTVYVNRDSFLKQKIDAKIDADKDTYCTVQYSSSDESVATVNDYGHVEGHKRGTATITVTVTDHNGNTVSDTCKVTVKNSPIWYILLQYFLKIFDWAIVPTLRVFLKMLTYFS